MSQFREEMNVIPRTAWGIAVAGWLAAVVLSWMVLAHEDEPFAAWRWWQAIFATGISLFFMSWVLLVGYVYGDARRRGMRYVMWTLLAIFIPNAIGIILYFVMRDRPMKGCPKCGKWVQGGFAFCPECGTEIAQSCPNCRYSIEPGWSHCPGCGRGVRGA